MVGAPHVKATVTSSRNNVKHFFGPAVTPNKAFFVFWSGLHLIRPFLVGFGPAVTPNTFFLFFFVRLLHLIRLFGWFRGEGWTQLRDRSREHQSPKSLSSDLRLPSTVSA